MMIHKIVLASLVLMFNQTAFASDCAANVVSGIAPAFTNDKLQSRGHDVCYKSFRVFASGLTKTPLWSAEYLHKENLYLAGKLERTDSFHPESNIPAADRAELGDYARSGYDRGHLAPNGNMPNRESQFESFSLANIVPQNSELNRGLWAEIESRVRNRAKAAGELYVVTGPAFIPSGNGQLDSLKGRVIIPTHIWKAVYDPSSKQAGVYWVQNTNVSSFETISLNELTSRTGVDAFPMLPASIKQNAMNLRFNTNSRGDTTYRLQKEITNRILKRVF